MAPARKQRAGRIRAPPRVSKVQDAELGSTEEIREESLWGNLTYLRSETLLVATITTWATPDRLYRMSKKFQQYANPPIVELVLGVQFDSIPGFTTGHSGWFWRECLGDDWKVSEGQLLPDQTEVFSGLFPNRLAFQLSQNSASRLLVENASGDRLLQIQHTRLHYNWRKKDGDYPHFGLVFEEFYRYFTAFKKFVGVAGLKPVVINQWEVTYVDIIPPGELWDHAGDFHNVLPGLFPAHTELDGLRPETTAVERAYEITPQRGRLHVVANLSFFAAEKRPSLLVNMTARGPIAADSPESLKDHMEIGHVAAGEAFAGLTSDKAKRLWEGKS